MKYILIIVIGLLLISLATISSSETSMSIWRCGDKHVIKIGDSQSYVLMQCGEPTYRNNKNVTTLGSLRSPQSTSFLTEEWFYNCGSNDLNTSLIFQGGDLKTITLKDYGTGESYCKGIEDNPSNKKITGPKNSSVDELNDAKAEQIKEETYQRKMKAYDVRIKALEEEAAKAKAANEARIKEQAERNK
jgi:hypothetical protein